MKPETKRLVVALVLAATMGALAIATKTCSGPVYEQSEYDSVLLGDDLKRALDAGAVNDGSGVLD